MTVEELIERRRTLWTREGNVERDRAFCEVIAREIIMDADNRRAVRERPWLLVEAAFTVVALHESDHISVGYARDPPKDRGRNKWQAEF